MKQLGLTPSLSSENSQNHSISNTPSSIPSPAPSLAPSSTPTTQKSKRITKSQCNMNVSHLIHLQKKERKKLTREEKSQIQRLKNKDSAQKSRDLRKVYMQQLEEENVRLSQKNTKLQQELEFARRYCWKCELEISGNAEEELKMVEEDPLIADGREFFDDDLFERVPILQRSSSSFVKYLFLVTMVVALFAGDISSPPMVERPRLLQTIPAQQMVDVSDIVAKSSNNIDYPLIPLSKTLEFDLCKRPFYNQSLLIDYFSETSKTCVRNLIKKNDMTFNFQKNLRLSESESQNKDLLFCHLPKIYNGSNSKQNNFVSRVFDIILQADQVKRIALTTGAISLQPFPYSGLYVVTAELKSLRKYTDTKDCLIDYV